MKFTEKERERRCCGSHALLVHHTIPLRDETMYKVYLSCALNVLLRFGVFSILSKTN